MPFDESKPLVAAALICEKVLREEGNLYSAIRIVDKFTMTLRQISALPQPGQTPPPATSAGQMQVVNASQPVDMSALVMLRAGTVTGSHEISIVVRDPNGQERPFPQKLSVDFKMGDPAEAAILNINLLLPNNAPAGLYWIDVLWDAEVLTRMPVSLRKEGLESAATQPASQP